MEVQKEKKAYMYKAIGDNLVAYAGTLKPTCSDVAIFMTAKGSEREKRYQVSAVEGEVRNNAVWLMKKDDSTAAKAFVRWTDAKMIECEEKLRKLRELNANMQTYIN